MAKPNYSYEKRQRELAKKKKTEQKEARKREAKGGADEGGAQGQEEPQSGSAG